MFVIQVIDKFEFNSLFDYVCNTFEFIFFRAIRPYKKWNGINKRHSKS